MLQKNESKLKVKQLPQEKEEGEEENDEDAEEFQQGEIDAFGNKREEKENDSDDVEMNDQ